MAPRTRGIRSLRVFALYLLEGTISDFAVKIVYTSVGGFVHFILFERWVPPEE